MTADTFDPARYRFDEHGRNLCMHGKCEHVAVIHHPKEHTGVCPTAEGILDKLSSPEAFGPACGVPDIMLKLEQAIAESTNPRVQHIDWQTRIRELGDDLTARQQRAAQMHVEHRARLLDDMRKSHTHPVFSCADEAHLEAAGIDESLAASFPHATEIPHA